MRLPVLAEAPSGYGVSLSTFTSRPDTPARRSASIAVATLSASWNNPRTASRIAVANSHPLKLSATSQAPRTPSGNLLITDD